MTICPHTALPTDTVGFAGELMRTRRIRHLPVVDAGKLRGIVVDHQLHAGVPAATVLSRVMSEALAVDAEDQLPVVLSEMVVRRCDAAVVTHDGLVVGVFTSIDALRLLRSLIDRI